MSFTVLVTGANGMVGRSVVHALLDNGYNVRALVRSGSTLLPEHERLTLIHGDIRNLSSLEAAMAGVSFVIHCAARKNDERDSEAVNIGGAEHLIEACRIAGVKRIVNVSTQSAKLEKPGRYGWSKAEADRLFHAGPIPVVTLRGSLVYGDMHEGIIGMIIRYSRLPSIPLTGNGNARFRPIHKDDLANIIVRTMETQECAGKIYDVGGPDTLSLNEIVRMILDVKNIHRRIIHLPVWLSLFIAQAASILRHPPLTVSNVLGSAVNVPMDLSPLERDIGTLQTRTFRAGLETILGPLPDTLDSEASMLLSYVLSSIGQWQPEHRDIMRMRTALRTHGLDRPLERSIIRSRFQLSIYDAATRLLRMDCLLQRKLLVAAAIAETCPASADLLLPREQTRISLVLRCLDFALVACFNIICAIPLMVRPSSLRHHAGTV